MKALWEYEEDPARAVILKHEWLAFLRTPRPQLPR